jgi:hypothetical protein
VKTGQDEVIIEITDPKILFYEKNPILGTLFNKALFGSISLSNEELSIVAEPYFFSPDDRTSSRLNYKWSLNGNPAGSNESDPGIFVVRQQAGVSGSAEISLSVINPSKLLLSAINNLVLNFSGR